MRKVIQVSFALFALFLAACTPTLQILPPPTLEPSAATLQAEQPDRFWWQLHFKLTWPPGESPDFSQHALIAEQLLLPQLIEHENKLPLWRFHRRAGRDDAGHQFSLIFFTDETTAKTMRKAINKSELTQWLIAQRMIENVHFRKRSQAELGELEHTSDPNWPDEIQQSWPYFIMGASQSWLVLVQSFSGEQALAGSVDYPALLAHYRQVTAKINEQWRDYGQHAYLHHLSAIFGYQPVRIRSSDLKTF